MTNKCIILTLAEMGEEGWQAPAPEKAICVPIEFNLMTLPNYNQMGKSLKAALTALLLAEAQSQEESNSAKNV